MHFRHSAFAFSALICCSCDSGTTDPAPAIVYPSKAVDAAATTWGTSGGLAISGGFGSAVVADRADPTIFWIMTDRGPNTTTSVANRLLFPLPNFTPAIGKFQLVGDSLRRVALISLKNAAGVNLSGRPNLAGQGATGETGIDPTGAAIPTDPDGLDSEGLAIAADGSFWVSDEYGPHIVHFDAGGRTIERINPFGTGTGGRKIPLVFALRRANRGMEGLAITPDGSTLIGAMQNPLDNPTPAIGRTSNANRILSFNIATGATKTFVYESDAVGNFISEIQALTATTFLVIERDANYQGGTPAALSKRIYKVDISSATDVSDPANSANGKLFGTKVLEALTPAERAANGIVPVTKSLVYDLLTHAGGYPHDKLEGVTLIGNNLLVVSNDDDFGVIDGGASNFITKMLPATSQRDRLVLYFIRLPSPVK
ncbi:MAG: esterase-like activity of phytase family protein [Phycisphaerae bacterium]|nr:esterase-like activity of phytase family protein [Gemmatimonadaceae bacterium]